VREPQLPRLGRVGNDVRLVPVAHIRRLHLLLAASIALQVLQLIGTLLRLRHG
jgi:hypothetical protein